MGGGGFGDVFLDVAAVPGTGPGGTAWQPAATPAFLGVAVKRLSPVRLQGQELVEWKQDALVCVIFLYFFCFSFPGLSFFDSVVVFCRVAGIVRHVLNVKSTC
jgi:hypothetical protein